MNSSALESRDHGLEITTLALALASDLLRNVGPNLPLLLKLHEIWSIDSKKIIKIVATLPDVMFYG